MNINQSDGWVKLHKSITKSDLAADGNAWLVFTNFLLMAHHESDYASIRFRGKQTYLKAGQFAATISELTEYLGISRGTLKETLKRLKNSQRVSQQTDNHICIFSICNWQKYQSADSQPHSQPHSQPTANHIANRPLIKRNKEIKNNSITNVILVEIQRMFDLYMELFGKNPKQVKLTNGRKAKLKLRLKQNGAEQLERAIRNVAASEFHRGGNDRGWTADLDFIIRSQEQVEKLAAMTPKKRAIAIRPEHQRIKPRQQTPEEYARAREKADAIKQTLLEKYSI